MSLQLRINEIFYSIQGESVRAGLPTTFIRLSGCPLRCHYCDTGYAFKPGPRQTVEEILAQVQQYPTKYITITGGEPLAQPSVTSLMTLLCDEGYQVSIETSGAYCLSEVDERVMTVMDLKTPGSGEASKNLFSNLSLLKPDDQIKFVICNEDDYHWAKNIILKNELHLKATVLMSPEWENQSLKSLAQWILDDGLPVRYQIQLHKVIWEDCHGPGI